jgi:hypothetical protein
VTDRHNEMDLLIYLYVYSINYLGGCLDLAASRLGQS